MSVIAKMQLNGVLDFGTGSLAKLSCVCENDLMAAYAKSDEDRLFTKYSPWGEMKVGYGFKDKHGLPKFQQGHSFYVVALRNYPEDGVLRVERPVCIGAEHVHPCSVRVIHDYGSSKQVELAYDQRTPGSRLTYDADDHPGEFFEPGKTGYWVAFYDSTKFSVGSALADAHSASVE